MKARVQWLAATVCVLALSAASPSFAAPSGQKAKKAKHHAPTMLFESLDKNHDGKIERSEWRGSEKSFEEHDWNHDGMLSGDEVKPGATRPGATPAAKGTSGAGAPDEVLFRQIDSNNDGRISHAEWEAAKKSPRQFDALDTNHDGFLSPFEFGVGR